MNYVAFLAMTLELCSQNYVFGERPTQCINYLRAAGEGARDAGMHALPIGAPERRPEAQVWIKARARLIYKACLQFGPMKYETDQECKKFSNQFVDKLYMVYLDATCGNTPRNLLGDHQ